jgi:two-component system OmpR family response regulator
MSPRQVRVLVVDDDDVVRRNLVAFLEDEGFEVVAAGSGEDASALMAGRQIDVAVVDIRLPGMNGNEFILQAHRAHPKTGFLIYTGSPDYDLPSAVTCSGVPSNGLLRKPLRDMRVLSTIIRRVAGEGASHDTPRGPEDPDHRR